MRTICTALFLACFAAAAHAQQGGTAQQQQRVKECNAEANQKNLKGEERQNFMSSCPAMRAQQACSKRAGDQKLKSDARKKFMTRCLRG